MLDACPAHVSVYVAKESYDEGMLTSGQNTKLSELAVANIDHRVSALRPCNYVGAKIARRNQRMSALSVGSAKESSDPNSDLLFRQSTAQRV